MPVQTQYQSSVNRPSGIDHSYELYENSVQDGLPSFQFRKRNGEINWRKLAALDVNKVARELDFITLQENISTVTFCSIDSIEETDPLFVKLFKMAQFTIEYLLHSQEYLQSVIRENETKLDNSSKENEMLLHKIEELESDVLKLKEENKKRRKLIQQQQMLIEAGASSYYQCPHCEKAFMNASFLQAHMQRRHPGCVNYIGDVIAHSQNEQAKLGNQLKQLEEELKTERETFNAKLQKAEEEKKLWTEKSQRDMDEWKEKEQAKMKEEMESLRISFLEEVDQLKKKEKVYQGEIIDLKESMNIRQTNLGELVDDLEEEKQRLRVYEDRVLTLEQLNEFKDRQIGDLNKTVKGLRSDSVIVEQQEIRLQDQEEKMKEVQSQLGSKPSRTKLTRLQEEVERISSRISSFEDSSTEADGIDRMSREEEILVMKAQVMNHLKEILNDKLRNSGVDPEAPGITSATLTRKLMVLKTERQQTAKHLPDYYHIRDDSRRKMAVQALNLSKKSPERPSKKKRATAKTETHFTPASRSVSFVTNRKSKNGSTSSDNKRKSTSDGKAFDGKRRNTLDRGTYDGKRGNTDSRSQIKDRRRSEAGIRSGNKKLSESRENFSSKSLSSLQTTPKRSRHNTSPYNFMSSAPGPRVPQNFKDTSRPNPNFLLDSFNKSSKVKESTPTPIPRSSHSKKQSSPVQSEGEDVSDWDDVSEIHADDDLDEPWQSKQTNVKQLATKLEKNLSSPKKKPPAGAINVLPRGETIVEKFHQDESDGDLFLISSSEDDNRKPGQGSSFLPSGGNLRRSATSNSTTTHGTSVWGSGKGGRKDDDLEDFDLDEEVEEILS